MVFYFETPDGEQRLDLDIPVPEIGSRIDWKFGKHADNGIRQGLYRITQLTWEISGVCLVKIFMEPVTTS